MEIFYTVLSGTLVYVLGQLVSRFVIEPIYEQKKIFAEIADTLIFRANIFGIYNDRNTEGDEATNNFRSLATKLMSKTYLVPFYGTLQVIHIVKPLEEIKKAHHELIGLSNLVYRYPGFDHDHVNKRYENIKRILGIEKYV